MIRTVFCSILLFTFLSGFGQQQRKGELVIVTGRVLNQADSALVKEWFLEGLKARAIENEALASEYFKRILEVDALNHAALYELARLYHGENQEKEAEYYARQAVTVNPENEWYWLLLADIYKKTGNLPQLELVFGELVRIDPAQEDYYYDRANSFVLQDKFEDAQRVYQEIEKKFGPSDDLAAERQRLFLKQGKSEKVIEELEQQIKNNPKDLKSYLLLADLYSKDQKEDKALELLHKAETIDPENTYVRLRLADLYQAAGKNEEAFSALKTTFANPDLDIDVKVRIILSYFPRFSEAHARAEAEELAAILVQTHPSEPKSFSVYGDVLFQAEKNEDAVKAYKNALALNEQVYQIWEQLIRIEITLSDFKAAVKDGEEALSLFPNQASLYFYTAIAYNQLQQFEKAISYLEQAASLEKENKEFQSQIYSSLGDALNALKKFDESDAAYEKSLEFDSNNSYTLNNYAYYLSLRKENLDKAEKMSKRSNELNPDNASFQDTYAWIMFRQKKYKEARIWIEKAIENGKNDSAVQIEHYGDILFFLGEKELALKQWKKAREGGIKSKILERKINEKKYIE